MELAVDESFWIGCRSVVVANPIVYHSIAIPVEECAAACLSELMWWCGAKSAKDLILQQGDEIILLLMVTYYRCAFRLHHSRPNEGKQT